MDRDALVALFAHWNKEGSAFHRQNPSEALGTVDTFRVLRPVTDGGGDLWVMARDIYWLGAQQATHIMRVTAFENNLDDMMLHTTKGDYMASALSPDEAAIVKEFRAFAAGANSGYAEAEKIQAESLVRFLADMERPR